MTYLTRESSAHSGAPIELYLWQLGDKEWAYTSADVDYTYAARLYLRDGSIEGDVVLQTAERPREPIEVSLRRDHPIPLLFTAQAPDGTLYMTIYREHRGEQDFIVLGRWRVLGCTWQDSKASLQCEPIFTSVIRPMLRLRFTKTCRHSLGDEFCKVNLVPMGVAATLSSVSGTTLQATAFATKPDGWFANGTLVVAGLLKRRIVSHVGDTIQIMTSAPGLASGAAVTALPGCNKQIDVDCLSKFANTNNHGGFKNIPDEDIFRKAL